MSKSLREGEIEELKSHCDIKEIVSGYINLKKAGKNFNGLCPFHKEKTPSFTVDTRKQLFHCFGCGEGGDVISFIEKIENLDFIEAAELLAKKVNYNLRYVETGGFQSSEKKSRLIELNELAKKYYNYIFFNNRVSQKACFYLEKRGFKKETLEKFEVGYSPEGWNNFSDFGLKRGFSKKELIDCGLAIQSTKNPNEVYDRFRGRIIFPIKDVVGRTVGFGGRIIEDNKTVQKVQSNFKNNQNLTNNQNHQYYHNHQNPKTSKYQAEYKSSYNTLYSKATGAGNVAGSGTGKSSNVSFGSAKYINTPETKIYSKSKNIYGLFEAKNYIVEKDQALVVEGYTDVMALCQEGVGNAVASCGTALTAEQVQLITRFTKNIVLVFDSDAAGENASLRGFERLKEYNERLDLFHEGNIDMKVAVLEQGYDPADYILQKGRENFLLKINNSTNIIDFTISMILKKYNLENISDKLRATDELTEFISSLSSKIVQEDCIRKISDKLKLRESLLFEQLIKKMQKRTLKYSKFDRAAEDVKSFHGTRGKEVENNIDSSLYPIRNIEIEALKILINGIGEKYDDILTIGSEYFRFKDTKKLYEILREEININKVNKNTINFPVQISSDRLEDDSLKKLYNLIVFSPVSYSDHDLASREVFNTLNRVFIIDKIEEIKNLLSKLENYLKNLNKIEDKKEDLLERKKKADAKILELNLSLKELETEKIKYSN